MTTKKQDEIINAVREAVTDVLLNTKPFTYELDTHRIEEIEELSRKLSVIIIGNGNPESGLVFKMAQTRTEVAHLTELAKTRSAREWSLSLVGIGLIATSIWQIITKLP